MTSKDILPGDIISVAYKCKRVRTSDVNNSIDTGAGAGVGATKPGSNNTNPTAASVTASNHGKTDVVPCDCLLLSGSAVANEASLTG